MGLGSPSAALTNELVFWSPEEPLSLGDTPLQTAVTDSLSTGVGDCTDERVSMYVKVFEEMLITVLQGEHNLFEPQELQCFMKYHRMPYSAQYLFCRLCLRKEGKWHRFSSLKYEAELGDGIAHAIDILCGKAPEEPEDVKPFMPDKGFMLPELTPDVPFVMDVQVKVEPDASDGDMDPADYAPRVRQPQQEVARAVEQSSDAGRTHGRSKSPRFPVIQDGGREIIDLTFDDDEEEEEPLPVAGPSTSPVHEPELPSRTPPVLDFSRFSDDEEHAALHELLDCLTLEELRDVAKQLKIKLTKKRRDDLIDCIQRTSANQTTLAFPVKGVGRGKQKVMVQSKLPFAAAAKGKTFKQTRLPFKPQLDPGKTQFDSVRNIVMKKLQKCIKLNRAVVDLFRRANLVYFRSTQHTPDLLTPALLQRAKKWSYATYAHTRTPDIWRSREELLAYEQALKIEAEVDELLDNSYNVRGGRAGRDRSTMSRTPAPRRTKTPAETPGSTRGKNDTEKDENVRVRNAREVVRIMEEHYGHWEALVASKPDPDEDEGRRAALQRFECGHVLTRVICKGAYAYGILHNYEQELRVLDALLAQRGWRRGRRGRWHDRRALILMQHLKDDPARNAAENALAGVIAALEDEDTHIVYRPMLERRLTRLERALDVPPDERHTCAGLPKKAERVPVVGVRVDKRMHLDEAGRVAEKERGLDGWATCAPSPQKRKAEVGGADRMSKPTKPEKPEKIGGKSVWRGRDGEEVSVEMLALQHYEDQFGCKGFHCEGRIVTTLFGLLFWDVLFAPVPGAFETPYQAAPLDLAEDTFYYARQALADARRAEIEAGRAPEILEAAHAAHEGVMCVGVRWDLFTKEELVGIARCMDPKALSVVCQLMCEDYAGRTGGVPDLILWHEEEGWAKFVEVKGPGDSLQENQKAWIDVLLQAGMPVEVCDVYEFGKVPDKVKIDGPTPKKSAGKPKTAAGQKRKRDESEDWLAGSDGDSTDYSQLDRHPSEDEEEAARAKILKKTPGKSKVKAARQKHKRAKTDERADSDDEQSPRLDRDTEDEEEARMKKRLRQRKHAAPVAIDVHELESPVAKVARVNSQPEVHYLSDAKTPSPDPGPS
ncbi:hypothetical protein BD413DRAFT_619127 [Trametes elegans]|nr:hypothetical protein BD413DRAFT_619127 [Trametes elegans]